VNIETVRFDDIEVQFTKETYAKVKISLMRLSGEVNRINERTKAMREPLRTAHSQRSAFSEDPQGQKSKTLETIRELEDVLERSGYIAREVLPSLSRGVNMLKGSLPQTASDLDKASVDTIERRADMDKQQFTTVYEECTKAHQNLKTAYEHLS
jgi:hypothetical protein